MSPLTLVGVLTVALVLLNPALGDVKHVLDGTAHPPECTCNQKEHHHSASTNAQYSENYGINFPPTTSQTGSPNNVPGSAAFWWADANSPFKHAYDYYKKCSLKGNCVPPVPPGFEVPQNVPQSSCGPSGCSAISHDLKIKEHSQFGQNEAGRNPFINGQITGVTAVTQGGGNFHNNPFLNGKITGVTAAAGGGTSASYSKNPFFNGQGTTSGGVTTNLEGSHIDVNGNPFLNQGHTAFSGSGHVINSGHDGFLGVQPSSPFGQTSFPTTLSTGSNNNQNRFSNAHQFEQTSSSFATNGPSKFNIKGPNCKLPGYVCVPTDMCLNGLVKMYGRNIDRDQKREYCDVSKEVCCRHPEGVGSSYQPGTTSGTYSTFTSSSSANAFGSAFANLSDITGGKSSVPGTHIKFNGNPGLSPGFIQVVAASEDSPNLQVFSAGQSGSTFTQKFSSTTNKVPRNTTPKPNSIFPSTIDYSNDNLGQFNFVSTTQAPGYLPPHSTPVPHIDIPDLEAPSISTYRPLIPTTSGPLTQPNIPVSIYTPDPFSTRPFKPAETPKPFTPYVPPSSSFPSRFGEGTTFSQKPYSPPVTSKPYVPPQVTYTQKPYVPPVTYTQKPFVPQTFKPYSPQPSQQVSHVTGGYSYPTPTPSFEYPTKPSPKPLVPESSFIVNNQLNTPKPPRPFPTNTITQFVPPSKITPGYQYPVPTPSFPYPQPSPSSPKPSISTNFNFNNQYISSKQTTSGFTYRPPTFSQTSPTPKPYQPQPSSGGYEYTRPFTSFPQPSPSIPPRITVPATNNGYLPPQQNRIPNESINQGFVVPKPTTPGYIPPIEGQPNNPSESFIRPVVEPVVTHAGCAAALKCVQEIYCSADGFISPTPVVITKDQEYLRVPTTECYDSEAGVVGKCCRDPSYIDPWPSANLINGIDNGQYREDPSLGQYFPQKQRLVRSDDNSKNTAFPIQSPQPQVNVDIKNDLTCGARHQNTQPRGPGALDAHFAEIPWQAMVLRDTNRSLLCGGVIVKPNAVLTAAHCVEGIRTDDVLVKGGEWKLGIDEEPLPFQIVKVEAIIRHPKYQAGSLLNDLALLMLDEKLRVVKNVAPLCLPSANQPPAQQCITTGWGKQVLQVHLRDAIMRLINVNILDNNRCSEALTNKYQEALPNYSANTICGYSDNDHCKVDYGSALACTNGNGQYTLAGIYSWDTGCKDASQIGGYVPPDVEWIESTCSKPLTQLKELDRQYKNN